MSDQNLVLPIEQTLDHILLDLRPLAWDIDDLIPDPENARKHDARNLKMICESFLKYGQRTPFTANRKTKFIQKGNGGYMAAKMIGWKWVAVAWTDDERLDSLAYGLADNRTSDTSTFDYGQAGKHLRELKEADYPMMQFWTQDEAMPLVRGEYLQVPITDETFDTGLQKGRAITKISASERISIDRAISFVRSKSKRSVSEGTALEQICGEFMALHVNELDNKTETEMLEITALSLD